MTALNEQDATTNAVPNPGSEEAYLKGCKCARMDNAYGRGYMCQPGIFVYTEGCPLHWPKGQAGGHHGA